MRFRRAWGAAAIALGLAVACGLSGCVADTPKPVASTTPTVAPVFASEEEALAAATEAYAAYLEVSDAILMDSGGDPERLLSVATESVLEAEKTGFAEAASAGLRSTGGTTIASIEVQDWSSEKTDSQPQVSVYACIDVSLVDVYDTNGVSVVSENRPNVSPFFASFKFNSASSLLLSEEVLWSGADFCN